MMMRDRVKRAGAALIAASYLFTGPGAWAANSCGSNPTSALAVTSDSAVINLSGGNGSCSDRAVFYNSPALGVSGKVDPNNPTKTVWYQGKQVTVPNYLNLVQASAANPNEEQCSNKQTNETGTTSTAITSSGSLGTHEQITFENSTSSFSVDLSNDSQYTTSKGGNLNAPSTAGVSETPEALKISDGRQGSIRKDPSSYTVTLPGGDYGDITIQSNTKLVFLGPVRLNKFSCASKGSVTFAKGKNYINTFSHQAECNIYVESAASSSEPVILNINGAAGQDTEFKGGATCINFIPAAGKTCGEKRPSEVVMGSQNSSALEINLLNGNLSFQNNTSVAANFWVQSGTTTLGSGPFTLVGSIVSSGNISLQNNESNFYFKAKPSTVTDSSSYSLAPPAVDTATKTGSVIYRTMQRDYQDDGSKAKSGHLKAFKLKSDSTQEATALWDAAQKQDVSDRQSRIYTQTGNASYSGASGDFELLTNTTSSAFSGVVGTETLTSSAAAILNPTTLSADKLGGRYKNSLIGTPWRTAPIIVGKSVLFATDDGILYSVKAGEESDGGGRLNWGWIPRQLLPHTAKYSSMAEKHPWGQISAITETTKLANGYQTQTYIVGTAMGGQLHFAVKVSADGDALEGVSWIDYQDAKFSPGSGPLGSEAAGIRSVGGAWPGGIAGGPSGGAAPTPAVGGTSLGATKVAYVYGTKAEGMKLMVRFLDGTKNDTQYPAQAVAFRSATTSEGAASTAPVVSISSNLLYLNDGAIYFGTDSGRVQSSDSAGKLAVMPGDRNLLVTDAILNINGAPISSGSGNGVALTAQTARRLIVLKLVGGTWTAPVWWTGLNAAGAAESSSEAVPKIVVGSGYKAEITAAPTITNGKVVMYVTKTKTGSTSCDTEVNGYAFGPLDLLTGASAATDARFRITENIPTDLMNLIGAGEAVGGSGTVFEGKSGVLTGTSKDTGLIAPGSNTIKQRLNWRELTNFF